MYSLRIIEKTRENVDDNFDYVTENFCIGTSYSIVRADSKEFKRIMDSEYPDLKQSSKDKKRALLCCENGQTFFIEEKDSLREYEYFIMTERGNTFEKL